MSKGFTLVETLIAAVIGLGIFGLSALMYGFTVARTSRSMSHGMVISQADKLTQSINETVSNAISCQLVTSAGVSGLKCTMPADGLDTDGDGKINEYMPYRVFGDSLRFRPGKRVWFYFSDASGVFGSYGDRLYRAERSDDVYPVTTDVDKNWTFYYSQTAIQNYHLVDSLLWSVDTYSQLAIVTIDVSKLLRGDQRGAGEGSDNAEQLRWTRKMYWRNWRT